jgi:hypothetical protein
MAAVGWRLFSSEMHNPHHPYGTPTGYHHQHPQQQQPYGYPNTASPMHRLAYGNPPYQPPPMDPRSAYSDLPHPSRNWQPHMYPYAQPQPPIMNHPHHHHHHHHPYAPPMQQQYMRPPTAHHMDKPEDPYAQHPYYQHQQQHHHQPPPTHDMDHQAKSISAQKVQGWLTSTTTEVPLHSDAAKLKENKKDRRRRHILDRLARIHFNTQQYKDRIYKDKSDNYRRELRKLLDGSHEDFKIKVYELAQQRDNASKRVALERDYAIDMAEQAWKDEYARIEKEYQEEKNGLRDRLLKDIDEKRAKLVEEKEALDVGTTNFATILSNSVLINVQEDSSDGKLPNATRSLRRRAQGLLDDSSMLILPASLVDPATSANPRETSVALPVGKPVKKSGVFVPLTVKLSEREREEDILAMLKSSGKRGRKKF